MSLHERLQAGETILGFANTLPAAGIIEIMSKGWDIVWIDCQHGQLSYDSALAAVRTAMAMGIDSLVRVPTHDPGLLGVYADLSPQALMIPLVDTRQQAEAVARALCFPPRGNRSFGGRRPIDLHGMNYTHTHAPLVVAQIESPEAIEHAAEIAAVDGIDMLFFGPDDVKLRLGIPMDTVPTEHPALREAMRRVAEIARAAGKHAGATAGSGPAARAVRELGYQLIMCGSDVHCLRTIAPQRLAEVRKALSEP